MLTIEDVIQRVAIWEKPFKGAWVKSPEWYKEIREFSASLTTREHQLLLDLINFAYEHGLDDNY